RLLILLCPLQHRHTQLAVVLYSHCKTTAYFLQRHCIPVCSSTAIDLQQHCNSFAVALQFVCSDAAANVQQLQAI
ncbi:UNVERIFIED_CONTAM: hypothetical protein NY603_39790, partial [Bacteroidetes bacterium 56_B9]